MIYKVKVDHSVIAGGVQIPFDNGKDAQDFCDKLNSNVSLLVDLIMNKLKSTQCVSAGIEIRSDGSGWVAIEPGGVMSWQEQGDAGSTILRVLR